MGMMPREEMASLPPFDAEAQTDLNMLLFKMRGHWDASTAEAFAAAASAAQEKLLEHGCPPTERVVLVDGRDHGVQSQEVSTIIAAAVQKLGKDTLRTAVLIAGALHSIQSRRISDGRTRMFDDEEAARQWLLSDRQR